MINQKLNNNELINTVMSTLGMRIKWCIAECGASVTEIAEVLGITRQGLHKAIRDNSMGRDNLLKLADHCKCDLHYLLSGKPSEGLTGIDKELLARCLKAAIKAGGDSLTADQITVMALSLYDDEKKP